MFLEDDWEFNVAGVYNYKKPGPLKNYFEFIKNNHKTMEGDILEAGVFQGRSLLGVALMLKEAGSEKKIYGFDTFSGFPPIYHENDDIGKFKELLKEGKITKDHMNKVGKNLKLRSVSINDKLNAENISLSGNFSGNSKKLLESKIKLLELDNVMLVSGSFDETMKNVRYPNIKLMAAILDCDLYNSYKTSLPFLWDRLVNGGYIYLDEYFSLKFPGARIATDEFFREKVDSPSCHHKEKGDFERWFVMKNS